MIANTVDTDATSSKGGRKVILLSMLLTLMAGCECEPKKCEDSSKPALEKCQAEMEELQTQLNDLKVKLAQALANPGTIQVDPSVLQIEGRAPIPKLKEGTLTKEQVIAVVRRSRGSLQACYTRALKRNSALHHGAITLTVAFKVKPSGRPEGISIRPNRDAQMTDCMGRAIERWTFPHFEGQPVGIESPVTLLPKND